MDVQQLINLLMKVEDKSKKVIVDNGDMVFEIRDMVDVKWECILSVQDPDRKLEFQSALLSDKFYGDM